MKIKILIVSLLLNVFLSGCAITANNKSTTVKGRKVDASGTAIWQIHYLPQDWVNKHLAGMGLEYAYVLLASPHRVDLHDAYSLCGPPSRIILGVVEKESTKPTLA